MFPSVDLQLLVKWREDYISMHRAPHSEHHYVAGIDSTTLLTMALVSYRSLVADSISRSGKDRLLCLDCTILI